MATDGICQGFQQSGGLAGPVGQFRAIEVETFKIEDLDLTIEWQVIGIFADQHMGQQPRTRATGRAAKRKSPAAAGSGERIREAKWRRYQATASQSLPGQ
ncbi:hypothetical protein DEA8626_02340 [Defluviimonas aquaemixtae]|uniref:Uncharacterized protein n=1 Tax=Albidovulum aquaemixtae TaxID=1542388 RepID=A0A2R8B806_9RHOB|nr:hypothetical protein DEA8626_02340 [Defluviimonas aquaemixtae]